MTETFEGLKKGIVETGFMSTLNMAITYFGLSFFPPESKSRKKLRQTLFLDLNNKFDVFYSYVNCHVNLSEHCRLNPGIIQQ